VSNLIHALADADCGGEMKHRIDVDERTLHGFSIANVANLEFDAWVQIGGTRGVGAVHLLRQVIQSADSMTSRKQLIGEM
jgi:hypothetical protein